MRPLVRNRSPYATLLRLALPVALSQLGYIAVQVADNAMVGAYGGDDPLPLSAVSFGGMVSYMFFSLALGVTLGMTPLVGELFARGDRRGSALYLQTGLVLYPLVGIAIMALQLLLAPALYHLGQPVEVIDMAMPYYRLMAYSIPATMLYGAMRQFLEGLGNTKTPMVVAIVTNGLNIVLNWVFIFGEWGSPPMGVYGAALATFVSRLVSPLLIVLVLLLRAEYRDYLQLFSRGADMVRRSVALLRMGFPIAGQMLLEGSAFLVTSIMMGWFGVVAISANQIGVTFGNCAFMMTVALGQAVTICVSHCYGLRDMTALRATLRASRHLALAWGAVVLLLFIALRHAMPALFTSNEQVADLASQMILFYALYQVSDALQCVLVGVLRGLQDVKIIAYMSFAAYVLINIPVGYFVAFTLGVGAKGLIVGYIFGLTTAALCYSLRVRRDVSDKKKLFEAAN